MRKGLLAIVAVVTVFTGALAAGGAVASEAPEVAVDETYPYWFNLHACEQEDGSAGILPCVWLGQEFGNRTGESYVAYYDNEAGDIAYLYLPDSLAKTIGQGMQD